MKKRLMAAAVALFVSSAPVSAAPVQNEIMFMLDSSGGLYDPAYSNWNAQIGWVQNFINQTHRADGSNAYGIMTFAGLSSSYSYVQNIAGNGLRRGVKVLHSLWPGAENPHPDGPLNPSSDQQPADLSDFTSGIANSDFLTGHTRTTDALQFVYDQFLTFGDPTANRYIFMLTDGGSSQGFESADPDTGYVSPVLQALQASDVNLAAVAIAGQTGVQTDMLNAMISDPSLLFAIDGFDDFSNFLPSSSIAMPTPASAAFLGLSAVFLMRQRRRKTSAA